MPNLRVIRLARSVNWYEPPERVADDPCRLLAQVMALGAAEDIYEAQALFSEKQFCAAYRNAPAGLFDRSGWAYWGLKLLGSPTALPFPLRFPEADWDWPQSFQDPGSQEPTTADDINWIAPSPAG